MEWAGDRDYEMTKGLRINKFWPAAFIYFFINTVGLPFGLTWMALLAPFFYVWVILRRKKEIVLPFLIVLLPFIFMHIAVARVDLKTYGVSLLNIVMIYIFCQAFYTFSKEARDPELIFRKILILNFIFCLIGIVFFFTPWDDIFWISQDLTTGISEFRRFKLFTYEASHYATLFVPIFFFYLLQYIFRQNTIRTIWLLPMLFLPLLLSFSLGVIGGILLALLITLFIYFRQLMVKRRVINAVVNAGTITVFILLILVLYFRHNPLFTRLMNIVSGADLSAKGRTADSFMLARKMLEQKNEWWGIGVGQVKLIGYNIVQSYYLYNKDFVATIPNAMAETLAVFGWIGFLLKLGIEIFLFFYTKPWTNYYRLLLFSFIFIYQFTGSYLTNLAEYVIWILAFTNIFRQFDVKIYRKPIKGNE
jgi:hypothetical protein